METDDTIMLDAATRLFAQHCTREALHAAANGQWPAALWQAVHNAGLDRAMVSETSGGAGVGASEALPLITLAAEYAAPIPLGETMLASWLADRAGLPIAQGPLTLASGEIVARREESGWHLAGRAERAPWGRHAAAAVIVAEPQDESAPWLYIVNREQLAIEAGDNLGSEPRDALVLNGHISSKQAAPSPVNCQELRALGAAVRTLQIAGALRRAASLAIDYAQQRVQFGRPIGKFQAVQQTLAVLATHVAAASAAADLAASCVASGRLLPGVAVAKARAGEAAGAGAAIAHQVMGAIGFTVEHDMQFSTKRLLAWRDEFGNEAEWNAHVGRSLLAAGPERLWPAIVAI